MAAFNNIPVTTFAADTDIKYQKIKTNSKGGKNVRCNLHTQTPRMPLAFDLSVNQNDDGRDKYEISLNFKNQDEVEKVAKFRDMLKQIDEFNITWAAKNSVELFGEDLTTKRDIVEDRYNALLKMPRKVEYAPTVRVRLQTKIDSNAPEYQLYDKEKKEMTFYDEETNALDLSFMTRGTEVVLLIEYTGIWVVGKKFGAGWKLVQGKVYSTTRDMGYALEDDPEEEDTASTQADVLEVTVKETIETLVED